MTTTRAPICMGCTRFHAEEADDEFSDKPLSCDAFPAGIPDEIVDNKFDHRRDHPGDNGIRFAPKNEDDAQFAEDIFRFEVAP